ncbi:MAG: hypothetical protein U5Q16_04850 [Gammaproteobacteria bacterium]|nr:hypothetical protein [Gammaproteobacteria bacterium]
MSDVLQAHGQALPPDESASLADLGFRSLHFAELALRVEDEVGTELNFDAPQMRSDRDRGRCPGLLPDTSRRRDPCPGRRTKTLTSLPASVRRRPSRTFRQSPRSSLPISRRRSQQPDNMHATEANSSSSPTLARTKRCERSCSTIGFAVLHRGAVTQPARVRAPRGRPDLVAHRAVRRAGRSVSATPCEASRPSARARHRGAGSAHTLPARTRGGRW